VWLWRGKADQAKADYRIVSNWWTEAPSELTPKLDDWVERFGALVDVLPEGGRQGEWL
jgi:hypothetical protein